MTQPYWSQAPLPIVGGLEGPRKRGCLVAFPKIPLHLSQEPLTQHHPGSLRIGAGGSPRAGSQSAGHLGCGPLAAVYLEADMHW